MKFLPQDVRRATLDDLPQLFDLWAMEKLPVEVLKERFTEFQLVADPDGQIVGAVGMQITAGHGRLHSELFPRYEHADELRPLLWERHKRVALNLGCARVWTQLTAPFWQTGDFHEASGEELAVMPPNFPGQAGSWTTAQLKEPIAAMESIEKELAMFRELERAKTEEIFRRARTIKIVAVTGALILLGWLGWWLIVFFMKNRGALNP